MPPQQPQVDWGKAKPVTADDVDWGNAKRIGDAPQIAPKPTTLQKIEGGAKDFAKGLGESAVGLMSTGDQWAREHLPAVFTNTKMGFGPPANLEHVQQMATPTNTTQAVGKELGDVAQFMIPGGLEERLAAGAPGALAPLFRIGGSALSAGAVNKAQGGGFGQGALLGGGGGVIGEGLRAAAPTLTGIAQGLEPENYQKTGKAILGETKGILPFQIRRSARNVLKTLNPQLDEAANKAGQNAEGNLVNPVNLGPAREAANEGLIRAAGKGNKKLFKGAKQLGTQLSELPNPNLGASEKTIPLPENVTPYQALLTKRGIGEAVSPVKWRPGYKDPFTGLQKSVYGKLNEAFENAVPEAAPLNRRISALIPATEKPKNFFFGHALGPGVGATLGGVGGWRRSGIPGAATGALEGAAAAFAVPSLLNAAARSSEVLPRVFTGAVAQALPRKKEK